MRASFKPQYQPYNANASELVSALGVAVGLDLKGKAGTKHIAVLASFLACVQSAGVGGYLSWTGGTTSQDSIGFSFYPAAGASTIKAVRQALQDAGYITHFDDVPSGLGGKTNAELKAEMGTQHEGRRKEAGLYRINAMPLLSCDHLQSAEFIDAQRPYVLVNKPEDYADKVVRKAEQRKAPKLSKSAVYKGALGKAAALAERPVRTMNAYWRQHPLTLPGTNAKPARYFASATRIFHNGRMDSGSRWYGPWIQMPAEQRLKLQIDGEPVCEIDLNASQPTLFSTLLGIRMNVGSAWTDVYASLVELLDVDEEPQLLRKMVKQVLVEMIGTGSASRTKPAKYSVKPGRHETPDVEQRSLFFDCDHSRALYQQIQAKALEVFPALQHLDTGYFNGTGFLSYHEAEILTQTLLKLKDKGVVAYGVHDCIIVKASDKDVAVNTYRTVIHDYALSYQRKHKLPVLRLKACVSIEQHGLEEVTLEGCYLG